MAYYGLLWPTIAYYSLLLRTADYLLPAITAYLGTPSDLLPLDLGRCGYEKGSDGKMLHVLTNPNILSVRFAQPGWTVRTLLRSVANAEPRFNALIDTGALITGLSNKQVSGVASGQGVALFGGGSGIQIWVRFGFGFAFVFGSSGVRVICSGWGWGWGWG